jgi:hypothetical protein
MAYGTEGREFESLCGPLIASHFVAGFRGKWHDLEEASFP